MKGVILAGGEGTRLRPNTLIVGKQLLPVFDKPMIYYPLSTLIHAGVTEVLIICRPDEIKNFHKLFGDGEKFGISISLKIQEKSNGVAEGVLLAEDFAKGESFWFILGDNLFHGPGFGRSLQDLVPVQGSLIFTYRVMDPRPYGVAVFDEAEQNIIELVEKPTSITSKWAIPGLYYLDSSAVLRASSLVPSNRGELEILDLLNTYLNEKKLKSHKISRGNAWFDLGTPDSLLKASMFVEAIQSKQGMLVGSPEEASFRTGHLTYPQILDSISDYKNSDYGIMLSDSLN